MAKVLITGSSGFIGTHLVQALNDAGHQVMGLDIQQPKERLLLDSGFTFWRRDVLDRSGIYNLFSYHKFDVIFHLAAGVGPEHVVEEPYSVVRLNVEGTYNVLKAAQITNPNAKFIFTSTSEVYGNSPDRPFNEDTSNLCLGPSNQRRWCYAASKLTAEHLVLTRGGMVARIFNTSGPSQSESYVLPRFVGQALRGEDITLYGGGTAVRCFCHVEDTVKGLLALMEKGRSSQVYNVGSDTETTIGQLARRIQQTVNPKIAIFNQQEGYEGSLTMPYRRPDLSKIRKETGWMPRLTLDTIIQDIAEWKKEEVAQCLAGMKDQKVNHES